MKIANKIFAGLAASFLALTFVACTDTPGTSGTSGTSVDPVVACTIYMVDDNGNTTIGEDYNYVAFNADKDNVVTGMLLTNEESLDGYSYMAAASHFSSNLPIGFIGSTACQAQAYINDYTLFMGTSDVAEYFSGTGKSNFTYEDEGTLLTVKDSKVAVAKTCSIDSGDTLYDFTSFVNIKYEEHEIAPKDFFLFAQFEYKITEEETDDVHLCYVTEDNPVCEVYIEDGVYGSAEEMVEGLCNVDVSTISFSSSDVANCTVKMTTLADKDEEDVEAHAVEFTVKDGAVEKVKIDGEEYVVVEYMYANFFPM